MAKLEHINITVSNPERTAKMLCKIFNWKIRWQGPSIHEGTTIHVGNEKEYIAIYRQGEPAPNNLDNYQRANGLNHIGILVDGLDQFEDRVKAAGLKPYSHQTYDPGQRFYFRDDDQIEYEVVSYR